MRRTRRTLVRLLLAVPLLAAGIALGPPSPVAAAARVCINERISGTIRSALVVPAGKTCILESAVVRGGVTVDTGGTLDARDSEIRGSVTATSPLILFILDAVVRGSVSVTGGTQTVYVGESEVRGNVSMVGNVPVQSTQIDSTIVRGSVTFVGNTSDFNIVLGSTIAGSLTCADNAPVVTNFGYPNTVGGAKTGECEFL